MAEGFANHYGGDVLTARSAGLSPVLSLVRDTRLVMEEMNVDIANHVPRPYDPVEAAACDIVVNMSGYRLPGPPPLELIEWKVKDPYGSKIAEYRVARGTIEQMVMRLILDLRRRARG